MCGACGARARLLISTFSLFFFATAHLNAGEAFAGDGPKYGAPEVPVESGYTPHPTPTAHPTETPTPPPSKEPCVMFVSQRGPGTWSIYHGSNPFKPGKAEKSAYSNVRYPNVVLLWIGGDITPDNWKNYFTWSGDFTVAGWKMKSDAAAKYAAHPDGRWVIDPCNRNYGGFPACKSKRDSTPSTFTHNGVTYQIHGESVKGDSRPTLGGECTLIVGGQTSPLVVDLKKAGVKFTPPTQAVAFELGGDSKMTHWVANGRDIAFLALDSNNNGVIDNGSELFGNTAPAEGSAGFSNGFEALAAYDRNGDGTIDANDPVFGKLLLWYDANANGRTDAGELVPVRGSAIRSFDLSVRDIVKFNDKSGNLAKQEASVALSDGGSAFVYDVWFAYAADGRTIPPLEARSAPADVPAKEASSYSEAYAAYQKLLKDDNWAETEFPFQNGKLRTIRDTDGNVAKLHASWKHSSDSCSANVYFSPEWRVLSSRVDCVAFGPES